MRARPWVLVTLAIVLGGAATYAVRSKRGAAKAAAEGRASASASADRPVPVATVIATPREVPIWLEGLGTVAAFATVTVKPQVDGRLDKVSFTEGQSVKAGDLLAQIDPRPFQIALLQQQASLARDNALLKNAKVNLDRQNRLKSEGVGSQQAVDDATAQVAQYEGVVALDAAGVENARLQLDYAAVKAPLDGVTGVRLVDPGNVVHANDANAGIVVLTQLDQVAVFFTLPEDDLPQISAEMRKGPLKVEVFARDGSTKLGDGTLALIDNQINTATATIKLKAILKNPDRALWPNQFVRARLSLETRHDAILVPSTAVQRGPKGTFAYVVGKDGTAQVQEIGIDVSLGEETIISSGLTAGQAVITEGQSQLRPGAKLDAKDATKGGPWTMGSSGVKSRGAGSASASAAPSGSGKGSGRTRKDATP
jgi:multidrug efflux system membrane fusion protein